MIAARDYRPVRRFALALAVLQLALSIGFIWRSSYLVEGQRCFALFDDALISLRYAENLATGHGLVWNPGERVEGYTNFLWTLILAAVHKLPLSQGHVCLVIQILGIPLLWACLWATVRLGEICRLLPVSACCAVTLTALHYNLMYFGLLGMETALLTVLITCGLMATALNVQRRVGRLQSVPWFALAVLCRLDAVVVIAVAYGMELLCARSGRWRTILAGMLVVATLAGQTFWRHSYYGEWLPNTYYLKATGWPLGERLITGLNQSMWIGLAFGLPLLLALATLLRPHRQFVLLLAAFGGLFAYHIYVGGDAWPLNRFVIPASIGLFVAAAQGMHIVYQTMIATRSRRSSLALRAALVGLCLLGLDGVHAEHLLLIEPPQTVPENAMNARYVRAIQQVATSDASVAVIYAGLVPYFTRLTSYDLYGKCDPHIARLPAVPGIQRAGHNKFDFMWSLRTHRPDILLHALPYGSSEVRSIYHPLTVLVDDQEMIMLVRRDSRNIRGGRPVSWDEASNLHARLFGRATVPTPK